MRPIKLLFLFLNKEELPEDWKESIFVPTSIYKRAIRQFDLIIVAYQLCQLRTKLYPPSRCQV